MNKSLDANVYVMFFLIFVACLSRTLTITLPIIMYREKTTEYLTVWLIAFIVTLATEVKKSSIEE